MGDGIIRSKFGDVFIPDTVSLTDYLLTTAQQYGHKTALIDASTGATLTFHEIIQQVQSVGSSLWKHGVRHGDVLLAYLPNCIEYPVILHGILIQGAILSTCNPAYTAVELSRQLKDSHSSFIFTLPSLLPKVQDAIKRAGIQIKHIFVVDGDPAIHDTSRSTSYSTLSHDTGSFRPHVAISPRTDIAMIPYSSGTSGLPKGVMLSHYNILANLLQFTHPGFHIGESSDVYVAFLPFYHIYAIAVFLNFFLFRGTTVVVMREFDPVKYLTHCATYKATILHVVPPVALLLAKHPVVDKFDLSSVYEVIVGAAPLNKELSEELKNRLKLKFIRQAYGMTELSPVATMTQPMDWKHGSAGVVAPTTEIKIVNVENGRTMKTYERGEVCVRGPQIMVGYLGNVRATTETIDQDGWLHTGDVGYCDEDDHLFIVDRIKELIKYKGFQVAPAELEALLLTHPSVADVAVIGIPDDAAGELPRAYIVLKPKQNCTEQNIHDYINDKVAYYKQLRGGIDFRDVVPKSPSGKILRRLLRDEYKSRTTSKL